MKNIKIQQEKSLNINREANNKGKKISVSFTVLPPPNIGELRYR